jgi:hypothetical protein
MKIKTLKTYAKIFLLALICLVNSSCESVEDARSRGHKEGYEEGLKVGHKKGYKAGTKNLVKGTWISMSGLIIGGSICLVLFIAFIMLIAIPQIQKTLCELKYRSLSKKLQTKDIILLRHSETQNTLNTVLKKRSNLFKTIKNLRAKIPVKELDLLEYDLNSAQLMILDVKHRIKVADEEIADQTKEMYLKLLKSVRSLDIGPNDKYLLLQRIEDEIYFC